LKVKTLALPPLFLIVLVACLQTPVATAIDGPPPPAELLWMDKEGTNIALSKDGQYVAAVGSVVLSTELRFYGRSSGTPIWTYYAPGDFWSVAISADGSCVAAGNGSHVFFWKNAKSRTPGNTKPTWTSENLFGPIEYRSLDISDDGNYVVASGTGDSVFYWGDAKGISPGTTNVPTTWEYSFGYHFARVHAVDLSSDGNYVVAGTNYDVGQGYAAVAYWKNAKSLTGHPGDLPPNEDGPKPDWMSKDPKTDVVDVVVSDDGEYVAAASETVTTLYYWAGAKSKPLHSAPQATWQTDSDVHFSSVDMSSDGDKVVAGGFNTTSAEPGVYFWNGAKGMTGNPQRQTWNYKTVGIVHDVAINAAGDYMAAANDVFAPYVYFFDSTGDLKWTYDLVEEEPNVLSISSDGGTLAIGTRGFDSRHLVSTGFKTPPPRAVGGFLLPADKLALLSPWIAVALAAVALTIFTTKRRREL